MKLELWQWIFAVLGALLVGVSKTGVAGLGLLAVVMFAQVFPAKQATGLVLPLLICGDIVAVASYRRHAQWRYLWKLFPWTAAGVLAGFLALGRIDDRQARVMIGGIVLALLALHFVRRRRANRVGAATNRDGGTIRANEDGSEHGIWFAPVVGVLAGFTTLVANAAGPLMVIYFLAMRLPKMEFVGTGAFFFLLLNLFKVPFMTRLGLINGPSLTLNLWLVPAVLVGAYLGRKMLVKMDQRLFENVALGLSAVAGLKLLW